jgi:hypothetical protein
MSSKRVVHGAAYRTISLKSVKNADTAEEKGYDAGKKLQA